MENIINAVKSMAPLYRLNHQQNSHLEEAQAQLGERNRFLSAENIRALKVRVIDEAVLLDGLFYLVVDICQHENGRGAAWTIFDVFGHRITKPNRDAHASGARMSALAHAWATENLTPEYVRKHYLTAAQNKLLEANQKQATLTNAVQMLDPIHTQK